MVEKIKNLFNKINIHIDKKIITITIFVIVFSIALGTSLYFFNKYQELRNNPNIAVQNEVKDLVKKVGAIINLPDEIPTVVTVQDKDKINGEAFFANAENGDIALIFSTAMKAVLYRPSENKIIEVGLFNSQSTTTSNIPSTPTSTKATVTIRNGTTISGLANLVAKKIILNEDIKVAFVGNAVRHTYLKTVVIDITGKNTKVVSELAKFLGAIVTELPAGESKSKSDILIIAGKDMK